VLGSIGYLAPELMGITEDDDVGTEKNDGSLADESSVEGIYSDKLTTKTDVYAYAAVTLEVCFNSLESK
jgi:hypothetical protein